MSGIYIHIPYCHQKCNYCNFHFSTQLDSLPEMVQSITKELELRAPEWEIPLESLYFGGGTPSFLPTHLLEAIIQPIFSKHSKDGIQEFTLECNPEDISKNKLKEWKELGINRLSIGIQSFFDEELQYMNRSHSVKQALQSIEWAKQEGFHNITIDLIYGGQFANAQRWEHNLRQVELFDIPHFSAYALTVEPKTQLAHAIKMGKSKPISDELQFEYFQMLQQFAIEHQYTQYEISNFAKNGFEAVHNSNYWKAKPYVGIGPSAHSFDGKNIRKYNVSNNALYIKSLNNNQLAETRESLSEVDLFNELIMIGLRSQYGIQKNRLSKFSTDIQKHFNDSIQTYIEKEIILENPEKYFLDPKYYFQSDGIAADLFLLNAEN